jgi:anti-sigma factor RsiW
MGCREWEVQILRRQEGELDQESEAALLGHLKTCGHCRNTSDRFSEIDRFLIESPEPSVPSFLHQRIVSLVIEEMRQDAEKSTFHHFIAAFAYFRPALAGIILVVGIGLGVLTGLNLSHSRNTSSTGSSYDVLALAGIEGEGSDSSLEAVWTDANGGGR